MCCWGELKSLRAQSVGEVIDFLKVLRFSSPVCAQKNFELDLWASLESSCVPVMRAISRICGSEGQPGL